MSKFCGNCGSSNTKVVLDQSEEREPIRMVMDETSCSCEVYDVVMYEIKCNDCQKTTYVGGM